MANATTHTLAVGDFIRTQSQGSWEYAQIVDIKEGRHWLQIWQESRIAKGTPIYQCVWKKDSLQPRRSYRKPDGPAVHNPVTEAEQQAFLDQYAKDYDAAKTRFDAIVSEVNAASLKTPEDFTRAVLGILLR